MIISYGSNKEDDEIVFKKDQYKIENLIYDKDRFESQSIFASPSFQEVDDNLEQLMEDLQERTEKIVMAQNKWEKKQAAKEKKRNSKRNKNKNKRNAKVEADADPQEDSEEKDSEVEEVEEEDEETKFYQECVCYILHIDGPSMHRP